MFIPAKKTLFCLTESQKKKNEEKMKKNLHNMFFVLNLHPQSNAIGLWCNGNTTVFGAVIQGSNPCGPTKNLSEMRGFFMELIEC